MSDQTKPRTWRAGDPEPGLDVQAVQHTNSQVFLRRPWPVRYGPRNATTVWQAGKLGHPLSWERLTERLHGHTLTEFDPSAPQPEPMYCSVCDDETRDATTSAVRMPAEPGNASERLDETPETMLQGELQALARTHASEQPICGQGHPNPRLDHVRCTQATGHTSSHRAFADPNCTCYTWNASERPNAGQRDASARAVERATWAMWRADGEPTGVAKRDPYRKLARALDAEGLLGPWTEMREATARADAAEAKLAETERGLRNQIEAGNLREVRLRDHLADVEAIAGRLALDLTHRDDTIAQLTAERDEARAKLDEIRDAFTDVVDFELVDHFQDNGDCIDGCPACALSRIRTIVVIARREREAGR